MSIKALADAEPVLEREPDFLYETIDDKVKQLTMSAYESSIAYRLSVLLDSHARKRQLGVAYAEMLLKLKEGKAQRRPDVIMISDERWPMDEPVPTTTAWAMVSDLAVEVVSPTNLATEVDDKIREYFDAGVRLVWVVFPRVPSVHVYASPLACNLLQRNDVLTGGEVLPEFQLPLAEFFHHMPG